MAVPVQLYVYDLSNGLARQLSQQLTGRQIDGIWHTSVVVFGMEIFYGQGISITRPGQSHHGRPMQVVDMGETSIDQGTFKDYLDELRSHYTADKYHLLDFNCNSFTNDVVGFLTGGSIPSWISDLPADFLSTPFGAALRPTIDNMFRRPEVPLAAPPPVPAGGMGSREQAVASNVMQALASRAMSQQQPPLAATEPMAGALQISTNAASLRALISSHRAAAILFTAPATCPPCRIADPAFEQMAHEKAAEGLAFIKVDLDVGRGREAAAEWNIRATPTCVFLLDGNKVAEVRGANLPEIKTQIDLLVFQLYPPHPHTQLKCPAIQGMSLKPILYTQAPDVNVALPKLLSFVDGLNPPVDRQSRDTLQGCINTLTMIVKSPDQFSNSSTNVANMLSVLSELTVKLVKVLPASQIFPLVDFWRIGITSTPISVALSAPDRQLYHGIDAILNRAFTDSTSAPRTLLLTTLRMTANIFSTDDLVRKLLLNGDRREKLVSWLVGCLLCEDSAVRIATGSVAFNLAAFHQKAVRESVERKRTLNEEQDWVVEIVSALVEALQREVASEDVVHRLVASLAFFVYLSPVYQTQLADLLEVLQAKQILQSKLSPGGCGEKGVQKKEVRSLIKEVADILCP